MFKSINKPNHIEFQVSDTLTGHVNDVHQEMQQDESDPGPAELEFKQLVALPISEHNNEQSAEKDHPFVE